MQYTESYYPFTMSHPPCRPRNRLPSRPRIRPPSHPRNHPPDILPQHASDTRSLQIPSLQHHRLSHPIGAASAAAPQHALTSPGQTFVIPILRASGAGLPALPLHPRAGRAAAVLRRGPELHGEEDVQDAGPKTVRVHLPHAHPESGLQPSHLLSGAARQYLLR